MHVPFVWIPVCTIWLISLETEGVSLYVRNQDGAQTHKSMADFHLRDPMACIHLKHAESPAHNDPQ